MFALFPELRQMTNLGKVERRENVTKLLPGGQDDVVATLFRRRYRRRSNVENIVTMKVLSTQLSMIEIEEIRGNYYNKWNYQK